MSENNEVATPVEKEATPEPPKTVEPQKPVEQEATEKPAEAKQETKHEEQAAATATVTNEAEKMAKQLENMTIFGNKSLEELHRIQSQRSHLSAGDNFHILLY
jgi:anti-sigma28 factor (negative regulator of flagellin synthesis)